MLLKGETRGEGRRRNQRWRQEEEAGGGGSNSSEAPLLPSSLSDKQEDPRSASHGYERKCKT